MKSEIGAANTLTMATHASILRTRAFRLASSRLAVASVNDTTAIKEAGKMDTAVATAYCDLDI